MLFLISLNALDKILAASSVSFKDVYLPTDSLTVEAAASGSRPLLIKTFEVPDPEWQAADLLNSIKCPHFSNIAPAGTPLKQMLAVLGNLGLQNHSGLKMEKIVH